MRRFIYLPFVLLTSCAPDERMPLSDCDYGLYWAECGGNGEPVVGCDRESGDCRWFTGGVTARGYAVADRPVLGFCQEGWPFSDFRPDGRLREHVVRQMSILSSVRVEREGANDMPVVFVLAPPIPPQCWDRPACIQARVDRVGRSIVVSRGDSLLIELEILPSETRSDWTMRLYRTQCLCTDRPIGLYCRDDFFGGEHLTSGVLHLNTDDLTNLDALHGRVEGVALDGQAFTFEF